MERQRLENSSGQTREGPIEDRHLNSVLQNISDIVTVIDTDGTMMYVSPSVERALGFAPSELTGKNIFEYIHPEDISRAKARLESDGNAPGRKEPIEGRVRTRDGGWMHCEASVNNLVDDPEVGGIVLTARDITARKEMERALQESEERWRSLVENVPNLVMIVEPDGTLWYINRTVSGITMEEAIGSSIYDYIEPKDHDSVREQLEKVFATGEPGKYVIQGTGPDGSTVWYETYIGSVRRGRKIVAAAQIATDITARKELEQALQESEEKWRSLVERAPALIVITDREGRILFINRTISGASTSEFTGKTIFDFVSPEERDVVRNAIEDAFSSGKPTTFEAHHVFPNGRAVWLESHVGLVRWEKGESAAAFVSIDVTGRKKAEAALAESEEKFRSIFDNATDGMLVADPDDKRFLMVNRTMSEMLGYSTEEVLELSVFDIHLEKDLPYVLGAFEKQTRGEESLATDIPVLRKDGSVFYADVNSALVALEGRHYLLGIFRDMTERRRMEEELKKSQEELRSLYTRLSDVREEERTMVAREIHDGLGQSLAVLSMQIDLLRAKPPKRPEAVSEKLLSMEDLVERSIAEMRRICTELRPGVLDHLGLGPAIEWQAQEFQERTGIRCHVEADLENTSLDQSLATAVFRILQESLANVARHSGAGDVWIDCGKKGRRIELVVSDDGKGITERQTSSPKSLGIAGMRERAREWGGELDVSGVPDEGTTVAVRIPIRRRARQDD
jgi:PAS domain S-box-containing protein